jgi:hypothetical protein
MTVDVRVWAAFLAFVAVDSLVFHRRPAEISLRAAAALSAFWIALGMGSGVLVWTWQGPSGIAIPPGSSAHRARNTRAAPLDVTLPSILEREIV